LVKVVRVSSAVEGRAVWRLRKLNLRWSVKQMMIRMGSITTGFYNMLVIIVCRPWTTKSRVTFARRLLESEGGLSRRSRKGLWWELAFLSMRMSVILDDIWIEKRRVSIEVGVGGVGE
jgi:hypothetical protein